MYLGNNGRLDAARATGTLRISKTVTMQLGDVPSADDEFTFTVELTNSQDVELPADLTFAYELLDSRTDEPVLDEQRPSSPSPAPSPTEAPLPSRPGRPS